jgi:hypothetical protein
MGQNPQPEGESQNLELAAGPGGGGFARGRVAHFFRRLSAEGWLTILALLIWVMVHGDYGITWDEPVQSNYGEAVRKYIFNGQSVAEFSQSKLPANIVYYEPALDLTCATVAHLFGADIFAVRHGVQGLLWVAMFYPVCALGRRILGGPGAWFAGFALLGMPSLFGQAFNNPKDFPLACAAIWLVHTVVGIAAARQQDWRHAVKLGVAAGFVLMMRPGAWFLGTLLVLVPLAHGWRSRGNPGWWREVIFRIIPVLSVAVIIGWFLMILPWPNAWYSPLLHPIKSASLAMHFKEIFPVLLRGTVYPSNRLPWDYLISYLLLTLPVPFLALAAWGHLVCWRKRSQSIPAALAVLGIGFLIWFPLATFVIARPNVYDGLRHFLFILPPFAVLVGVAAADVHFRLQKNLPWLALPVVAGVLLSAVPAMVRLHPYENVYFNFLAGPKATLHERYETDYWASSYREAAAWINEVQSHRGRQLCVLVSASDFSFPAFTHFLDPKVKAIRAGFNFSPDATSIPEADYCVATVRYNQWQNYPALPIVHRIERDGVLLAVIRENPHPLNR